MIQQSGYSPDIGGDQGFDLRLDRLVAEQQLIEFQKEEYEILQRLKDVDQIEYNKKLKQYEDNLKNFQLQQGKMGKNLKNVNIDSAQVNSKKLSAVKNNIQLFQQENNWNKLNGITDEQNKIEYQKYQQGIKNELRFQQNDDIAIIDLEDEEEFQNTKNQKILKGEIINHASDIQSGQKLAKFEEEQRKIYQQLQNKNGQVHKLTSMDQNKQILQPVSNEKYSVNQMKQYNNNLTTLSQNQDNSNNLNAVVDGQNSSITQMTKYGGQIQQIGLPQDIPSNQVSKMNNDMLEKTKKLYMQKGDVNELNHINSNGNKLNVFEDINTIKTKQQQQKGQIQNYDYENQNQKIFVQPIIDGQMKNYQQSMDLIQFQKSINQFPLDKQDADYLNRINDEQKRNQGINQIGGQKKLFGMQIEDQDNQIIIIENEQTQYNKYLNNQKGEVYDLTQMEQNGKKLNQFKVDDQKNGQKQIQVKGQILNFEQQDQNLNLLSSINDGQYQKPNYVKHFTNNMSQVALNQNNVKNLNVIIDEYGSNNSQLSKLAGQQNQVGLIKDPQNGLIIQIDNKSDNYKKNENNFSQKGEIYDMFDSDQNDKKFYKFNEVDINGQEEYKTKVQFVNFFVENQSTELFQPLYDTQWQSNQNQTDKFKQGDLQFTFQNQGKILNPRDQQNNSEMIQKITINQTNQIGKNESNLLVQHINDAQLDKNLIQKNNSFRDISKNCVQQEKNSLQIDSMDDDQFTYKQQNLLGPNKNEGLTHQTSQQQLLSVQNEEENAKISKQDFQTSILDFNKSNQNVEKLRNLEDQNLNKQEVQQNQQKIFSQLNDEQKSLMDQIEKSGQLKEDNKEKNQGKLQQHLQDIKKEVNLIPNKDQFQDIKNQERPYKKEGLIHQNSQQQIIDVENEEEDVKISNLDFQTSNLDFNKMDQNVAKLINFEDQNQKKQFQAFKIEVQQEIISQLNDEQKSLMDQTQKYGQLKEDNKDKNQGKLQQTFQDIKKEVNPIPKKDQLQDIKNQFGMKRLQPIKNQIHSPNNKFAKKTQVYPFSTSLDDNEGNLIRSSGNQQNKNIETNEEPIKNNDNDQKINIFYPEILSIHKLIKRYQFYRRDRQIEFPRVPVEYNELVKYEGQVEYYDDSKTKKYKGCVKDGKLHGRAIMMRYPKGGIYDGLFSNGVFSWGLVIEVNPDNILTLYTGPYNLQYELKHGEGIMQWIEFDKQAEFVEKETHNGEWILGQIRGRGKRSYKTGEIYIGDWFNGLKQGDGILYYKQEDHDDPDIAQRYEGGFLNNKFHGSGKYYHKDGKYEVGEYFKGRSKGIHKVYKNKDDEKENIFTEINYGNTK